MHQQRVEVRRDVGVQRWREEVVPGASLLRVVSLGGRAGTFPPPKGGGDPRQLFRNSVHGD